MTMIVFMISDHLSDYLSNGRLVIESFTIAWIRDCGLYWWLLIDIVILLTRWNRSFPWNDEERFPWPQRSSHSCTCQSEFRKCKQLHVSDHFLFLIKIRKSVFSTDPYVYIDTHRRILPRKLETRLLDAEYRSSEIHQGMRRWKVTEWKWRIDANDWPTVCASYFPPSFTSSLKKSIVRSSLFSINQLII